MAKKEQDDEADEALNAKLLNTIAEYRTPEFVFPSVSIS